jgi:hypothetical protein
MHVHLGSVTSAEAQLAHGVAAGIVGVRDMGTPLDQALTIRAAIRADHGPEVYICGPLLNGDLPFRTPLIVNVTTPEGARATVDQLLDADVDFIKVHDVLESRVYDAIAAACRRRGMPFAGHVPVSVTAAHAAAQKQRSIEHLGGRFYSVLIACSRDEHALAGQMRHLLANLEAEMRAGKEPDDRVLFSADLTRHIADTFDTVKADALLAQFIKHHTWNCPTMVSMPLLQARADPAMSPSDREAADAAIKKVDTIVRRIASETGRLLAGTDASLVSGKLPDELERLAAAGVAPLDVLRAATLNPARFLGRTEDFGEVREGMVASLVLLDGNPLEAVSNTRRVAVVILRGRIVRQP